MQNKHSCVIFLLVYSYYVNVPCNHFNALNATVFTNANIKLLTDEITFAIRISSQTSYNLVLFKQRKR